MPSALKSFLLAAVICLSAQAETSPEEVSRFNHLLESAIKGDAGAQYLVGRRYSNGYGVKTDMAQAAFWFKKSGEQGNVVSQVDLGDLYSWGLGVPKDLKEAAFWYKKAADQDHPSAIYNLALLYNKGEGIEKDNAKATELIRKACRNRARQSTVPSWGTLLRRSRCPEGFRVSSRMVHKSR